MRRQEFIWGEQMIAVLIAANENDRDFWNETVRLLERGFATVRAYGGTLTLKKPNPSLVLCDTRSFEAVRAEHVMVVFKEARPLSVNLQGARQVIAVVDSSDDELARSVSETRLPAITCGLHSRDTITLSSMDEDSAMIGIQRTITGFDGSRTEPQEIPVRLTRPVDRFALMTTAAAFILSGNPGLLMKGKM